MPCRFFSAAVKNSLKNSIYLPTETFIHSILYSQQWPDDNDPCIQVREWKPTQLEPSHSMSDPLEFCLKASSVVLRHLWGGIEKKKIFSGGILSLSFFDARQGTRCSFSSPKISPNSLTSSELEGNACDPLWTEEANVQSEREPEFDKISSTIAGGMKGWDDKNDKEYEMTAG